MSEIPRIVLGERPVTDHSGQTVVQEGREKISSESQRQVQSMKGSLSKDRKSSEDNDDDVDDERRDSVGLTITHGHMPIRSSSDIGLPATSMPNLALSLMSGGGVAGGDSHLGVYCSPRASRRSVDLEITAPREDGRGETGSGTGEDFRFDWSSQYEGLDFSNPGGNVVANTVGSSSNSNTLRVLTSSSRAASALSLTSDCTARSIGLLSNDGDSDSDADASLMSDTGQSLGQQLLPSRDQAMTVKSGGTAQLRRYLSHPEESVGASGSASEVGHARPSVSLINIKSAEANLADPVDSSRSGNNGKPTVTSDTPDSAAEELDNSSAKTHSEVCREKSPHVKDKPSDSCAHSAAKEVPSDNSKGASDSVKVKPQNNKKSKLPGCCVASGGESFNTIPQSLQDGSLHARTRRADAEERIIFSVGGASALSGSERSGQRILSYKCDQSDNSRNGRIRQWLQDMDKLDLSTG
ncbi:hypothetical protein ElyMa_000090300 [Elysia marginata]|uniref:Uncharacterized protein n=1 Tax=Elysia marginata TaxID=1093978 RepID=A0AAV4EJ83_9GAST|nr:hypothetical protein ElyMa_000090300 [Elysia marginata]